MLEAYTDGASRGNPGHAASAFLIVKDGEILQKHSLYVGKTTNNVAEYTAIIEALKALGALTRDEVRIYSDSQLAIRQLSGAWRVKKEHLIPLYTTALELSKAFSKVNFVNVRRTNRFVQIADALANKELDSRQHNCRKFR